MTRSTLPDTASPAGLAGTLSLGDEFVVNRMGFGAMRLTGPGIWGPPADRAECARVVRRAVELGVNFIDTADSYGPAVSEEIIAEALYPYPDGLVIATKGGLTRPGPNEWHPRGRPAYLRRCLEGSLRRLRLERIDLWQLHRIDPEVPAEEQFGTLAEFVREGLVRLVGLSEVTTGDLAAAQRVVPIASVQNRYNVVDRQWDGMLDDCERQGIAFIPWFPLAAGALDDKSASRPVLERIASRHDATPTQVALAWLLARSAMMLPIPGTSKVSHLDENVAAAGLELSSQDMAALDRLGAPGQPAASA